MKVTDGQGTRYFLYDGLMPVLELDANKKITASYLYGADGVVYRRKRVAAAYWHFDEGNGIVAHDVDGYNHGILGKCHADTWSEEHGGSLYLDGDDNYMIVLDSDALDLAGTALTLSCWVKRAASGSGYLVRKSNTSDGYALWITTDGNLQFDLLFGGTTKSVTGATVIPTDTWTHVAARYDGSALRIFINGTQETASTDATESLAATGEALWLGFHNDHRFNGYLNDVSLYNRALSDAEITNLSNNQAGRYEYHHTNALGSNIVLTDDNKNVLVRYEYDVFGAVRSEVGTSGNTRKFTGKEYESDVKLYYYGARYYDPHIGRFTQRDPAGDGVNWYAYAYNNPLGFVDPTGLRPVTDLEEQALLFTFGDTVGGLLAGKIDVQIQDESVEYAGLVPKGSRTDIKLHPKYESEKDRRLYWLSVFIHEATHIWQNHTGRHREGRGGEDYQYTISQVISLDLKVEEHAQAVTDWFYVTWGFDSGWLTDLQDGWNRIYTRMGIDRETLKSWPYNTEWFLNYFVQSTYHRLIQEIRNPDYLPRTPDFP